jgi:predicted branched-subunit amino acid permease
MIQKAVFGAVPELAATRREAFVRGMRMIAPGTVATAVWGLVTGVAMIKTGLSSWEALGMTLLVYAGSAQLAALPLIAADAPVWVVIVTALVVNLRFVIFSASLQPYFQRFSLRRRVLLGYVTTDLGVAVFISRYGHCKPEERGGTEQVWVFLGMAFMNWLAWQPMSIAGIFLAGSVPGHWGLEFTAVLALMAIMLPMLSNKPAVAGAATAAVVAVLAAGLPLKLGLLVAVICGMVVAMGYDVLLEHKSVSSH